MSQVASRYAEAFFDLAKEEGKLVELKTQLDEIGGVFSKAENLKEFFASVNITKDEKKKFLDGCLKNQADVLVLNLFKVLVDKNRIGLYEEVIAEFHKLANKALNIREGEIYSARPLSASQIKDLETALSKDSKVVLIPKIDESLISGFRIVFDDEIIDKTMKEKVNRLNEILNRKGVSSWN